MFKVLKKVSFMILITLLINNFNIIRANATENNSNEVQELANIILFVDFADSTDNFMDNRRDEIIEMYNGTSIKSLSKYISIISNGKMLVNNYFPQDNGNTIETYRLSKERSYYNKLNEYEMIKEIVNNVSISSNINLDMNNDGEVDNITFIFAGSSADSNDVFWPHKHNHNNGSNVNGKGINTYNVHNENSIFNELISGSEGVIAHEFLHSLGLPDLYRSSGTATPVGAWDIMASNSKFMQYPLTYLRSGWVNIDTITESGRYTLNPASSSEGTQGIIIKTPFSEKEFFVVEYRKKGNPYKDELEAKIPGTGLIIYRVNTDKNTNFTGPEDYIYVFRPGETGEGDGNGDLTKSFLSLESGRTSYGLSDLNAKITDGAITYSSGINSGIVIKNVSSAGDTISFDIDIPDLSNVGIWSLVGNTSVNNSHSDEFSMDVVNNEVYVTYTEEDNSNLLKVAKFNGTSWTELGSGIADKCYDSKIKVHNGTPYVIYHDSNYKLVAEKFENSEWKKIQNISSSLSQYSEMISTESGLYIAYTEPDESILKISKLNTNTNKFEQIGENVATGYIYGISLAEANGDIYVSYSNFYESDKIHVKKYSEGIWNEVGSLDITAKQTNLTAKGDKLYLSLGVKAIQVYEFKDNNWNKIGEDIAGKEGRFPILQILDDDLYIAYNDITTNELKVKVFNGSEWIQDGIRVTDKSILKTDFKIVNGNSYIGYIDKDGIIQVKTRVLKENTVEYEVEDVDKNGVVDIEDIAKVAFKYGVDNTDDSFEEDLDINRDNIIDVFDLVLVSKKL
ncbi:immune inhibitor A domain-containing protein [uncultured Clostridium sp.]|uniref:immune inhibitor A domain-containing protein n=1 Tax=uncultured Clostridium sp. TaxID=59620 RepID=UPI0011DCC148|nr:immune inhibitor A domain-containing protein [uncultured Clostridium sp.]